jgi:hypothetical protein
LNINTSNETLFFPKLIGIFIFISWFVSIPIGILYFTNRNTFFRIIFTFIGNINAYQDIENVENFCSIIGIVSVYESPVRNFISILDSWNAFKNTFLSFLHGKAGGVQAVSSLNAFSSCLQASFALRGVHTSIDCW